ncbi:ras association domain-containing protein 2-like isoform X2 [Triplophysa dalaica]|uniref:ras association domain-containing protein 2-like isoform X2 n=1 Tax=Triplophysa dalaica TaxID=1582913 RepID=UPI0024DF3286|nr:ras association domain-containing protein 2-like isoform X2 [Triplophysa dalaica]
MEDQKEASRPRTSLTSSIDDVTTLENEETKRATTSIEITAADDQSKGSSGEEAAEESTHSDGVVRTWSDAGGRRISGRRLGIRRVKRHHRCSFNGHFYNHKTAVFTPAFGSVTNVRINSCMTTAQVMRVLLNKFKIENSADEFSLYLVHTSGERHQLKPNDHPLAVRVLKGPCEQVSKIFLMELDQVEDVTYDVAQYIKFELPVLQGFITKLQEEEEREMQKLKRRYAELHHIIKKYMRSLGDT